MYKIFDILIALTDCLIPIQIRPSAHLLPPADCFAFISSKTSPYLELCIVLNTIIMLGHLQVTLFTYNSCNAHINSLHIIKCLPQT